MLLLQLFNTWKRSQQNKCKNLFLLPIDEKEKRKKEPTGSKLIQGMVSRRHFILFVASCCMSSNLIFDNKKIETSCSNKCSTKRFRDNFSFKWLPKVNMSYAITFVPRMELRNSMLHIFFLHSRGDRTLIAWLLLIIDNYYRIYSYM